MFPLAKSFISMTPHKSFQTDQRQHTSTYTKSYSFPTCQVILLLFPIDLLFCTRECLFSPHFLSVQQLLVSYSLSLKYYVRPMVWFIKSSLLNINLYINLRHLTILVTHVCSFPQNKFNPVHTVITTTLQSLE